ncbi:type 4a pilus biogenesis protein PilO [Desulfobulbus rhabdoformis]|jgi:type IV pilus assembly protein PilO|uniref:type 4a pilus biogenesis protein PilO n=1 Tax=Desulfobulbus rhabdoformis TaxID=34032 RepID=UPI001965C3E9|nr:type 4a pilus biogenesis protein PilO [Desulfobulbus rhabdoformis]MBM9613186.1 type 4a pilus biogenesis protein PilO [Desulfobulbus rhabdoformis]
MVAGVQKSKFDTFIDEKYIPFDQKNKLIVLGALFVLPLLAFYFLVFSPNVEQTKKLHTQIQDASTQLKRVRQTARDLPKHKEELKKTKEAFALTAVLLPKSQEIPDLLRNISDLGKHSGLDFLSFVPGGETPKDFYAEIPIDIKIRGPYHNLGLFLDRVSKLERIVTVNNIKTENVGFDGNEILLTSSCRLLTYRFTNKKLAKPKKKKRR